LSSCLLVPHTVLPSLLSPPPPSTSTPFPYTTLFRSITADDYRAADEVFDALARLGIDYAEVMTVLEEQGLKKFDVSWTELQETIRKALDRSCDSHSMSRSATNSMPRRHGSSTPVCPRVCSSRAPRPSTAPRTRPSAWAGWICRTGQRICSPGSRLCGPI